MNTDTARFVRILERCFRTSILSEAQLLKSFANLHQKEAPGKVLNSTTRTKTIMDDILEKNNDIVGDKEIPSFLQCTSNKDKRAKISVG